MFKVLTSFFPEIIFTVMGYPGSVSAGVGILPTVIYGSLWSSYHCLPMETSERTEALGMG